MIRRIILKTLGLIAAYLFLAAMAFFFLSLVLLLLVPAAFPALDFGFPNAMALAGIALIVGLPAMRN